MNRPKSFLWIGAALVVGGLLWALRHSSSTATDASGGADLYCGFESPAGWDISPEEGFTLERSTEHVTEGSASLNVVFPSAEYPSINTKRLKQPTANYDALTVDVFNPQPQALKFAVRVDDRNRKRMTRELMLEPGANHIRIERGVLEDRLDPAHLFFIVLFLNETTDRPTTLYFDNMRLTRDSAKPSAPEPTPPPAAAPEAAPAPEAPEPSVPELPAKPKPATSGELAIAVVKLRAGSAPQSLVSQGVPFAPGQLNSERNVAFFADGAELPLGVKVLARWPQDQSIRSLLVQFRLDVDQTRGPVTMRWGSPRTSAEAAVEPVAGDTPEAFLMLPARWLCDSEVIGEQVPMGDHDFPDYDGRIDEYYSDRRDDPHTGDIREDGYYSTPHVFYQLYVRSGDPDIFLAARREALHYREQELILEGQDRGRHRKYGETRYIYVEALVDDYLLTGDERSKEVAGWMADYLTRHFPPSKAFYPKGATNFWTEREAAFPFLGIMLYYGITGDPAYRTAADEIMERLYKLQRQWPGRGGFIHNLYAHDTEEGCRPDEYGGSPFMTGLLLEPIIEYHRLTGSPTAARSIFLALDWLMREGLAASGDAFLYLTCDMHEQDQDPTPDLNFLLVHGFGYGYRLSGYQRQEYLLLAHKLLERGVRDAFLKDRKHFNQNFRSSGHFFAYIQGAAPAAAATEPLADPAVLIRDSFDQAPGRWSSPDGDAVLELDHEAPFAGAGSMKVSSLSAASHLTAGWSTDAWDLAQHSLMRFAYKIPRGVPVGLRCRTQFGDWVALGGTPGEPNEGAPEGEAPLLTDDGQWHEARIDVAAAMHRVLSGVQIVTGFRFNAAQEAGADRHFWIDEFEVRTP